MAPGARFSPPAPRGPHRRRRTSRDQPRLLRLEQVGRITRHLRSPQLLQELQVVQHPETAAERGEHHRVLLGLNLHVTSPVPAAD